MFINAPTKEFTLRHLVTFSISRSRIRMKFYFVYRLIHLQTKMFMNETDSKIQGCYMSLYNTVTMSCNYIESCKL